MTPDSLVFDSVFYVSSLIHENTTDYIKGTDEELRNLPIILVGEATMGEGISKQDLTGSVTQTVHVYGSQKQRKEVNNIVGELVNTMKKGIPESESYRLTSPSVRLTTLTDTSMSHPLIHKIVDFTVNFSKKI